MTIAYCMSFRPAKKEHFQTAVIIIIKKKAKGRHVWTRLLLTQTHTVKLWSTPDLGRNELPDYCDQKKSQKPFHGWRLFLKKSIINYTRIRNFGGKRNGFLVKRQKFWTARVNVVWWIVPRKCSCLLKRSAAMRNYILGLSWWISINGAETDI